MNEAFINKSVELGKAYKTKEKALRAYDLANNTLACDDPIVEVKRLAFIKADSDISRIIGELANLS